MTAETPVTPQLLRGIDRLLSVQRPVVLAHIRAIRHARPEATPEEVIRILERRYLATVTTSGAMVGASAVIPAVGLGASLALSGVETAAFLEGSALFAQSVTEVHGIVIDDPDRARALVMTMMLGSGGSDLVRQLAGEVTGVGPSRLGFWGDLVGKSLPSQAMGHIADQIKRTFMKRFVATQGTNIVGRVLPFGIGAVIGGTGNHILGRRVVDSSRKAFGQPPQSFPPSLEPKVRTAKEPRRPKLPKATEGAEGTVAPHSRGFAVPRIRLPLPGRLLPHPGEVATRRFTRRERRAFEATAPRATGPVGSPAAAEADEATPPSTPGAPPVPGQ
jgi:hypothetical protein